jgi:hypothetical protein
MSLRCGGASSVVGQRSNILLVQTLAGEENGGTRVERSLSETGGDMALGREGRFPVVFLFE